MLQHVKIARAALTIMAMVMMSWADALTLSGIVDWTAQTRSYSLGCMSECMQS